jgi:hypothetical protein
MSQSSSAGRSGDGAEPIVRPPQVGGIQSQISSYPAGAVPRRKFWRTLVDDFLIVLYGAREASGVYFLAVRHALLVQGHHVGELLLECVTSMLLSSKQPFQDGFFADGVGSVLSDQHIDCFGHGQGSREGVFS